MLLHAAQRLRLPCKRIALRAETGKYARSLFTARLLRRKLARKSIIFCRELGAFGIVARYSAFRSRAFRGKRCRGALIFGDLTCRRILASRALALGAPDKLEPRRRVGIVRLSGNYLVKRRRYRVFK